MKNIDSRLADTSLAEQATRQTSVTDSCGNVFMNLGFDAAEAQVMALRVELMIQLREQINKTGLTQAQAARQLGVTQPRISDLLKGTWKDFSMDMLLTLAGRLGLQPRLMLAT